MAQGTQCVTVAESLTARRAQTPKEGQPVNDQRKRDPGNATQLVDGVHQVTFLTEDMDRLLAFLRARLRRRGNAGYDRGLRHFDPDGAAHEVMLERQGSADVDMLERADWTTVELDD
jgi:hypothetical protein